MQRVAAAIRDSIAIRIAILITVILIGVWFALPQHIKSTVGALFVMYFGGPIIAALVVGGAVGWIAFSWRAFAWTAAVVFVVLGILYLKLLPPPGSPVYSGAQAPNAASSAGAQGPNEPPASTLSPRDRANGWRELPLIQAAPNRP